MSSGPDQSGPIEVTKWLCAMNTLSGPGLVMTMHRQPLVLTFGYGPLTQFLCRHRLGIPLDQQAAPSRFIGSEILVFKKCTQLQNKPSCIKRVRGLLAEKTQAQDIWNFGLLPSEFLENVEYVKSHFTH